jgi:hypothetical protein
MAHRVLVGTPALPFGAHPLTGAQARVSKEVIVATQPTQNKKEKKMLQGIALFIIKASFLAGGIALVRMPWVEAVFTIAFPIYQAVGAVILGVLVYLEFEPYMHKREKKAPIVKLSSLQRSKIGSKYLA